MHVPVAAEIMWVADTFVAYWCCLLAKTKFSSVQGVLRSVVFTLPALLHPPQARAGGAAGGLCARSGPFPA